MSDDSLKRIAAGEFFLIAGPCVAEAAELCLTVAEQVNKMCVMRNLPYVFKASYKKANRLSAESYSGPGTDNGLAMIEKVRQAFGIPVLTDVHETIDVPAAAKVADILQIPAFL